MLYLRYVDHFGGSSNLVKMSPMPPPDPGYPSMHWG